MPPWPLPQPLRTDEGIFDMISEALQDRPTLAREPGEEEEPTDGLDRRGS